MAVRDIQRVKKGRRIANAYEASRKLVMQQTF